MPPDYRASELELAVCSDTTCEALVPAVEMTLSDSRGLCYACAMIASGAVELELELEVA